MKSNPFSLAQKSRFRAQRPPNPTETKSLRYALSFLIAGFLCQLLFFVPLLVFFEQNYSTFRELSFDFAPSLVEHLSRERQWLQGFLISAIACQGLFFLVFGTRIFHRIFSPVEVIRRKINSLSKGYWRPWPLKIREKDDLGEIVESLNYLSATLHAQSKNDLKDLYKIRAGLNDSELIFAVDQLIDTKNRQIGTTVVESGNSDVTSSGSSLDSNLAS